MEENKQKKAKEQKGLQRLLMEMEAYRRQAEELARQMQLVESRIIEIESTMVSLESLGGRKIGSEIMVPIGSDCFIRAELKDNENVIVGIGASVSIEETLPKAKEILKSREEKMDEALSKLQKALTEVNKKLVELESAYNEMIKEMRA
ncbi:MAG: prefoldin subunit alpha [Candidatus Altiarchaeota archaeon]|nr:prefoldin subunit alpha [Candidatus Altiarchaeota archaeon]